MIVNFLRSLQGHGNASEYTKWPLTFIVGAVLVFASSPVLAQEVAYLDLVGVVPRTELRHPPSSPPVCSADGTCTSSGHIFGSISCGAGDPRDPRALKVTLISLDRFDYLAGDRATIEVQVENTGKVDMRLPWSPHLADLQPADEKQKFVYQSLAILLELTSAAEVNGRKIIISSGKLFGVAQRAESWVVLKPAQSIRLRLQPIFSTDDSKTLQAQEYSVNVVVEFRSETFIPRYKTGRFRYGHCE